MKDCPRCAFTCVFRPRSIQPVSGEEAQVKRSVTAWRSMGLLVAAVLAAVVMGQAAGGLSAAAGGLELTTLSTRPELVTGGDVLLQVRFTTGRPGTALKIMAGGRDVTSAFKAGR